MELAVALIVLGVGLMLERGHNGARTVRARLDRHR
jgi:hypothetical protein